MRSRAAGNPDKEMPFTQHLEELRWHLLRSVIYLMVLFFVCWEQYDPIYHLMSTPVRHAFEVAGYHAALVYMDVLEPLFFRIQVVFAAAVILGLPLMLWELWRFILPGLYPNERKFVRPLLPFSILLAYSGCVLVYFALPLAFEFLLKFAPPPEEAQVMQHLQRYYFFLIRMMIGSALTFQTPIIMVVLAQLELITAAALIRYWRHAVLVCFTISAIITPTVDPFNMTVMAAPLCFLYGLSVILVRFVELGHRRRAKGDQGDPPAGPAAPGGDPPPPAPAPSGTPPPPPAKTDLTAAPQPLPPPPVVDRGALGPLALPPVEPPPPEPDPES